MNIELKLGDCIEVLKTLPENSVDSIVTDPPYGIGFMGKAWDTFEPSNVNEAVKEAEQSFKKTKDQKQDNPNLKGRKNAPIGSKSTVAGTYDLTSKGKNDYQQWCYEWGKECLRVLKPGGHLLASNSPRMYHRMAIGLEDAGFEIRDQLMWLFGSGFPKSLNIGKAIDKIEGNEREDLGANPNARPKFEGEQPITMGGKHKWNNITKGNSDWEGWGTALKPAHEPIVMARKPLSEKTNAENVLKWGTGGINIDGSRIDNITEKEKNWSKQKSNDDEGLYGGGKGFRPKEEQEMYNTQGRFPANVLIDEEAGKMIDEQSGVSKSRTKYPEVSKQNMPMNYWEQPKLKHQAGKEQTREGFNDEGGASRYFKKVKVQKGTKDYTKDTWGLKVKDGHESPIYDDEGGPSRFFYCPKVSTKERNMGCDDLDDKKYSLNRPQESGTLEERYNLTSKNHHPTVKPIKLMEYLIKLVTRKGGVVLDPFLGSGSTGMAAKKNGYNFIGIEKEPEYMNIAERRIGSINPESQLNLFEDASE